MPSQDACASRPVQDGTLNLWKPETQSTTKLYHNQLVSKGCLSNVCISEVLALCIASSTAFDLQNLLVLLTLVRTENLSWVTTCVALAELALHYPDPLLPMALLAWPAAVWERRLAIFALQPTTMGFDLIFYQSVDTSAHLVLICLHRCVFVLFRFRLLIEDLLACALLNLLRPTFLCWRRPSGRSSSSTC